MHLRSLFRSFFCMAVCLAPGAPCAVAQARPAVQLLLQQGNAAMQGGDLAGAATLFQQAVDQAPSSTEAHFGLGLVQLRTGALEEAITHLRKAGTLNPRLPGAHLFLGMAEFQEGRLPEAVRALQGELALNPRDPDALLWLGIVDLGAGHPEEATVPLDKAAQQGEATAEVLYYQAKAHSQVAEAAYRRMQEKAPDSALVHRALAESYGASRQPEKALTEYTSALQKEPDNADLYEGMGEQLQLLSRFPEARAAYEHELALNPHSGVALYHLGRMDVEADQAAHGVELLQKAQVLHVSDAACGFYLGLGLAKLDRNDEAARWLRQALGKTPTPFVEESALFQLARVEAKLGHRAEAQEALQRLQQAKARRSPGVAAEDALPSPGGAQQP